MQGCAIVLPKFNNKTSFATNDRFAKPARFSDGNSPKHGG